MSTRHQPSWIRLRARAGADRLDSACIMCHQPAQWTLTTRAWPWCKACLAKHLHPALLPPPHPADEVFAQLAALSCWTASETHDLALGCVSPTRWLKVVYNDVRGGWDIDHYDQDRYRTAERHHEWATHTHVVQVVRARLIDLAFLAEEVAR